METAKRKYTKKNLQKTYKGIEIYEDFVTHLLEDNPNYFALKTGYWDYTRTVYSLKEETIKDLKKEEKELFNQVYDKAFKHNQKGATHTKLLISKLDEVTCKINDIKQGKKLYYKVIDFAEWKLAMQTINFIAQDKLIDGEKYKVTGVGNIEMVRVERSASSYLNPKYSHIDSDDYILLRLNKVCRIKNRNVYKIRPLFGDKGVSFKYRIFEAIGKRPELKGKYPYITKKNFIEIMEKIKLKQARYKELKASQQDGSI